MESNIKNQNLAEGVGSTISAVTASVNQYIPQQVYNNLPEPLKEITNNFSGRERDIILLSSIGVLSTCLPNVFGIYDERKIYPNLNIFIIAPPASGKGVMNWSKKLVEPIHNNVMRESRRKISEYNTSQNSNDPKPKLEIKIVPGNTSTAKIYQHLESAQDSLLIFESEADSLSQMLKQDWGNFSDLLRKAFHHETVSLSRQTEDRFLEIRSPKLSIVVSGTPNQVKPLIESKENGLFSRFVYYFFDDINGWKDVSPKAQRVNHDDLFESKAAEVLNLHNNLRALDKVEVRLNNNHWDIFQGRLTLADSIILQTNKVDFIPVVRRFGTITFRIIMIMAVLRKQNQITEANKIIYASDEDVTIGIELMKILLDHSLKVFDKYEKNAKSMTMFERNLYSQLSGNFRRNQGLEIAERLNIPERTFDEILKRWEKRKLLKKVRHGQYEKLVE